jgi:hypothetical protein
VSDANQSMNAFEGVLRMFDRAQLAEAKQVTMFERYQAEAHKQAAKEQPMLNRLAGAQIVNSQGVKPGTVITTGTTIYRPDVTWSYLPKPDSRRWAEWFRGRAETPLLWEGSD